jgi:protein-arginine kinase activator protein McsA
LESAGVLMEGDQMKKKATASLVEETNSNPSQKNDLAKLSVEELNDMLNDVLEQEDYIKAVAIRDELKSRKK